MLKFYRNVLAAGVVALGLAACGDKVTVATPPPPTPLVHSVSVVPLSVTATVGQTGVTFVASVVADSGISSAVSWISTNPLVATLASASSGAVTIVAAGQTTIVATSVGDPTKSGAGSLQVVALPSNISSFSVTPTNASIAVGGALQASTQITQPAAAPVATIGWATSNVNIASVNASGQITGVSAGTAVITATATSGTQTAFATVGVTVGSGPAGVISFSVSPSAMTLFATQSQQATATVTVAPTFTAPAVTWTSLAPTVATVSSTGLITAVAQGTAVVTASIGTAPNTLTQPVLVTVAQGSSISITAINQGSSAAGSGCPGTAGLPVVLTNVACQIDVVMNLNPGVQPLDSLVVRLKQPAGFKTLAKQNYGNTIPSSGLVTLSINTANFVKNPATGTAPVDLVNGPTTLQTQVYPHLASGGVVFNCQVGAGDPTCAVVNSMVLNNVDGWAADITKPTNSATESGSTNGNPTGTTYWGGPGATGVATAELYPVVYNNNPANPGGSALNRCKGSTATPATGATPGTGADCISTVSWTVGEPAVGGVGTCGIATVAVGPNGYVVLPLKQTYGPTGSVPCLYENTTAIRDNIVVTASSDAQNNPFARVGIASLLPLPANPNTTLIGNTVVFGSTPDSLRLDYLPPSVATPSIARVAPMVTGWVNASFNFINFAGTDGGVGPVSTSRATFYTSVTCPTVTAVNAAMPTGTGADINGTVACPTNFIGGAVGISSGNAPWTVNGTEVDRLGNLGTSGSTPTFGTDYTPPAIRWGLVDGAFPLPAAYGGSVVDPVDSTRFQIAVIKAAGVFGEFRAEYLDERSGFYNTGQVLAGIAAQVQGLAYAGHLSPVGVCQIGTATVSATFVTNPGCISSTSYIAVGTPGVRLDGWQPGQRLNVPLPEGYYGYKTWVVDEAGNKSATLFRSVLINNQSPFSTGLGVPAILTSTIFNFIATFSDSAEVIAQSLQVSYPVTATTFDSLRYTQSAIGLAFDNVITSPFSGNIAPPTGAPYAHSIELTTGAAFPASNVNAAGVQVKPASVKAWSWNPGSLFSPGAPVPGVSPVIPIPGLNVESNNNIFTFNATNPLIAITNFRIITTVSPSNQFGSVVALRGQVSSPTNAPNPPFARVDFYRQVGTYSSYLGSVSGSAIELSAACSSSVAEVCGTDQGTYRSWVYQLPAFVNRWDGAVQAAVASGDKIIAVGVVSSGDALMTQVITMTP